MGSARVLSLILSLCILLATASLGEKRFLGILLTSGAKTITPDLISLPAWCADAAPGLVIRGSLLSSYK